MATLEQDTRSRLLDAAYELMLSQGYAATGVSEICTRAGVSKGSFYHFFETKQQCAMEMIDRHMAQAQEMMDASIDLSGAAPDERGIAYVRGMEGLAGELFRYGCMVGAFAVELAETHPELQAQVSRIFSQVADEFEGALKPLCEALGRSGPSSRDLAEQMLMTIEGGVVLAKAHGDNRFVTQGLRCFRHYLETLHRQIGSMKGG